MFGPLHPVLGFYHAPPIWIDEAPRNPDGTIARLRVNERVFRKKLRSGLEIAAHRSGTFFFDFSTYLPPALSPKVDATDPNAVFRDNKALANRRVVLMNAFLTCLYHSYDKLPALTTFPFFKMTIVSSSLVKRDSLDGSWLSINDPRLLDILSNPMAVSWDEATRRAQTIPLDAVSNACDFLSDLIDHRYDEALLLVDLFLRSVVGYENDDYTVGLLMAWSVIEKLLNHIWERYIESKTKQYVVGLLRSNNHDVKKYPKVSAAAMIYVLTRETHITSDLESYLTAVREARNSWMHGLTIVGRQDAAKAKHGAEELLQLAEGISFNLSLLTNIVH